MTDPISRRTLFEMTVAGASAAAMASSATAQSAQRPAASSQSWTTYPEGEKVGYAIVGLGKLALEEIIPAFKHARGSKLAAVVSGDPAKARRVAAENGLPASAVYSYADYERMANDPRIQVVYIVLPNSMHAEYTIRALKAGKHVLCEKPMATTIADGEAMIAAAKQANRKLMIAYRCHYEPLNLEVMRRVRAGSIGKPRMVVTNMGRQADPNTPWDSWRLDMGMSGGGALADMGVYGINAARYLLNEEPTEVTAWSYTDRSDPRFKTTEDLIAWQFRFPSGAIANGSTSFAYSATVSFQVIGETGRLVADPGAFYGGNRLTVEGQPGERNPQIVEIDQFAREMDWMSDVVRGKAPMVAPGEEGLQDLRLMKAIMDSAARGGAPIRTDWGYRRPVDPAAVVDVPRRA
ncbi:Gfo/Idh/MocA family protein [Phenylobacterium deserti]|uniref:Gfo/Idh/MocA family oxidoreductase n=1 Tax=Phenylobacterium deserti TaxID=1914756 RepID=A0A328A8N8_9CAUL|nr:Gfo/Idh/MocA family oxidoreductase [Phenylobacterium deserti]RAK50845.1 gfo/Idh/MocA family oxidoreductase [Phenylobacterium deserti]